MIVDTWLDYPDDESQAVEVFMQGCPFRCPSCQNEHLQPYKNSEKITYEQYNTLIIEHTKKIRTNKIVFVGGEPLYKESNNLKFIKTFLEDYSETYDVCIYTGYNIDYVEDTNIKGFTFIKTGQYIQGKNQEVFKTTKAMQFASTNQKLYDKNYNLLTENGKTKFKENN